MPTFTCVFYIFCIGALYLFRAVYQGWAISYLMLAMAAAPVLILLLSLPAMLSLGLHMEGKRYVMKGEPGDIILSFRSRRILPVGRVRVTLLFENAYTGESFHTAEIFHQVSGGEGRLLAFPTDTCGTVSFRVLRWECRDLLGFFSIRRKCSEMFTCTVLPAAVAPEEKPDLDAVFRREMRLKPKYGGGFAEDYDLRDYRPGDMGNSIHWKLSSKADRLIVREALVPENDKIFLVLSDAGEKQRGLEVLRWLSDELWRRELPHLIVSGNVAVVDNEEACLGALAELLSSPASVPAEFDDSHARCIFFISGEEVTVK